MSQEWVSTHEGWELVDKAHIQWNNSQVCNTEFPKVFPKGTESQLLSEATCSSTVCFTGFPLFHVSFSHSLNVLLESPPQINYLHPNSCPRLCFREDPDYNVLVNYISMCVLVAQLCPTLCHPMDCRPPDSSVHGILQAGTLERVAISVSNISMWHAWISVLCFTAICCVLSNLGTFNGSSTHVYPSIKEG